LSFKTPLIMSTLELKLEIFDKLKSVEDEGLLKTIMSLLKTVDQKEIYHLSEYELDMVKEGEEDIKFGRVISQEQLDKEDLEWLSKQ
jgi:hypothetical protein